MKKRKMEPNQVKNMSTRQKLFSSFLVISILLLVGNIVWAQEKEFEGTVTLSGAWAIYPTAVAWAEAFQKLHPKEKIDVSAGGR